MVRSEYSNRDRPKKKGKKQKITPKQRQINNIKEENIDHQTAADKIEYRYTGKISKSKPLSNEKMRVLRDINQLSESKHRARKNIDRYNYKTNNKRIDKKVRLMGKYAETISSKLKHNNITMGHGESAFDLNSGRLNIGSSDVYGLSLPAVFAHELYHAKDRKTNTPKKHVEQLKKNLERLEPGKEITTGYMMMYPPELHTKLDFEKRARKFQNFFTKSYFQDMIKFIRSSPRHKAIAGVSAIKRKSIRG